MIRTVAVALLLAGATACAGGPMVGYYKAVSTTAVGAGACREMLSDEHDRRVTAVAAKAKSGDPDGAQADLNRWTPTYGKIRTFCVSMKAAAGVALAAGPSVEAAVDRDRQVAAWIARLVKLGADAASALAEAGIKLPGAP